MSSRIKPIGHTGIVRADDHAKDPVRVDVGLMGVETRLMATVVNGLPPLIAQRVTPVHALGWFDLQDQSIVGLEFIAADDGPVLRRGADVGAVDRWHERVGRGPALKSRKNLRLS